ncbi:MAG: YegS/Rv2252/BmrU family lipid kinase [Clostridiales bacterium]|nr:YegS/Rv2252/BmrU family lipid kinase [Clostridiales bacterium]
MKYAFIINPESGQGDHGEGLVPEIEELIAGNPNRDIKVYYTQGAGDATVLAEMISAEAQEDTVVFACGGDGTIQEVANGLYGHDHGILGIVPVGSGNDFVRELSKKRGNSKKYLNLPEQFDGIVRKIDLIRISWIENGEERSRLIVNGINIGFDGNTAILAHNLKKLPLVSGTGSYMMAVAVNLAKKKGQKLRITADGKPFHTGELLLATAANGGFCGGGVNSCPNADLSDGLIELMIIKDIPRRKFVALFPKYKAGKVFNMKGSKSLVSYTQARNIFIEPMLGHTMKFVGDGEIFETGAIRVDILHNAIRALML